MKYDDAYNEKNIKSERSWWRRIIRDIYLNHHVSLTRGRTIDFGCGGGLLLRRLPSGSLGLEINQAAVKYCVNKGLNVKLFVPDIDNYALSMVEKGVYTTLISTYVFEHIVDAGVIIKKLIDAADKLEIDRLVFVVPGKKGFWNQIYQHESFVDLDYLSLNKLINVGNYHLVDCHYFPFPWQFVENFFEYQELAFIYEKLTVVS
jgi:SAM-dependent methyltransferase